MRIVLPRLLVVLACGATCARADFKPMTMTGPGSGGAGGAADSAGATPSLDAGPALVLPDASDAPPEAPGATQVPGEIACTTAAQQRGNAGCSFYAAQTPVYLQSCYAVLVVNPGTHPARLKLERAGQSFALATVARVPRGSGDITYAPYDEAAGLAPGDVAVLFLSGTPNPSSRPSASPGQLPGVPIPRPPAIPIGLQHAYCPYGVATALGTSTEIGRSADAVKPTWSSGTGHAFHLTSDRPVVAYDVNPYGGANSALTSASLLLPEEGWGQAHVAATPLYQSRGPGDGTNTPPYLLVVAGQEDTDVSLRPTAAVVAGPGVAGVAAGAVGHLHLGAGEVAQIVETATDPSTPTAGLSGTIVNASHPVALIGGTGCFDLDAAAQACDGAHQQIPPLAAWGHEYAAVRHRPRVPKLEEPGVWQIVAAVDGTVLSYAPRAPAAFAKYPTPAPTTLAAGQTALFWTADAFVVHSQDADHPFYVAGYMTSAGFLQGLQLATPEGLGDPEFVNVVATDQYVKDYTFLTDPTYPETSLVVVRKPGGDGKFADVALACAAGPLTGWSDLGGYQFTRVDLVTGEYAAVIPGCDNGRQRMTSAAPFAVTVWGWGNRVVSGTSWVSYAYPTGAALGVINTVKPPVIE